MRSLALLVSLSALVSACGGAAAPAPAAPAPAPAAVCPPPPAPAPAPAPAAAAGKLEGTWTGMLGAQLHLVLRVARAGDGYDAMLDSVDQGSKLRVDHITLTGGKLHFEIPEVTGTFDGTLDGDRITGTWTQGQGGGPMTFTRGEPAEAAKPAPPPFGAPIEVDVPEPLHVLHADGHADLVYELHVTNVSHVPLHLRRVEVTAAGHPLARLEGDALAADCMYLGVPPPLGDQVLEIGPGRRVIVFAWITLDGAAPAALDHHVVVQIGQSGAELAVDAPHVAVDASRPLVLAPPLRGKGWVAGNGPSNTSAHRRAELPIAGHLRIAQRFAIDWVQVGDDRKTYSGDPASNASYHAYGQPALAVAGGVVTEVKDGIPQNTPGSTSRAVPITLDTVAGNHVIVALGGGRFAMWAHLQPGSIKVKVGDHVRRGQVLGLVGNSGNSSEPHLHFQVMDASSPLGAEGLPYVLDAFDAKTHHVRELPTQNEQVAFP